MKQRLLRAIVAHIFRENITLWNGISRESTDLQGHECDQEISDRSLGDSALALCVDSRRIAELHRGI
jgi:hypothetical protein